MSQYRDDPSVPWYKRTSFAPVWVGVALTIVFAVVLGLMFGTQDYTGPSASVGKDQASDSAN
jgi:hypothetical protein